MAEGKKSRKFGRNSRRPSGGANQKMRTARNKRLRIEKAHATLAAASKKSGKPIPAQSTFAELTPEARRRGEPKRLKNEYTSARSSLSPKS
jgi:hypothetical protein